MKFIVSYVRPGHINRKFVIVDGDTFQDIHAKIISKIGKWHFSRFEADLKDFYPYTGKDNLTNIINNDRRI